MRRPFTENRCPSIVLGCAVSFRAFALLLVLVTSARAVILFRTGDPAENTTAPTGDLANSGWQYEGYWGAFTGTPIAPHYFISAEHFGHQGPFVFGGVTYTVIAEHKDPRSDLTILQVLEPFPSFAPLYSRFDEVGQRIAEFGRGRRRGAELRINDVLKGWKWGDFDPTSRLLRWGENVVSGTYPYGLENELLRASFDQNGLPNECHLAEGDSGGAAFINDNGTWKLAGINYAVDPVYFFNDNNEAVALNAALFDARGYYDHENNSYVLITGDAPVPTSFYPTRISRRLHWIAQVIAAPVLTKAGDAIQFTFTKLVIPETDLVYTVEQSTDLAQWSPALAPLEVVATNASVQTVKATFSAAETPIFVRLRITKL
jgi:hypothetical protein